ncbi:hypothetical protein [Mycobacterium sp. 236(2023)]|uniref:hypothetical protein n=1 Tax=Mycobacterium sp. 236(2023) TaxID=3038163 RepID=UPI0024150FEE|nr:hypothetical protein [Mycobacterium sp. 236(2023)]MDG4666202.1 hypothetical protein [Mycobacterium sp. 236(2023)]
MDALKIALVVFLALAVLTVIVVFVRGILSKGFPTRESSSHFDQISYGAMPPTPKPPWAEERDGESR